MDNNRSDNPIQKEHNPLHPFTTPEGYFDQLKTELMQQIKEEHRANQSKATPQVKWHRGRRILYGAIAAALLGFGFFFFNQGAGADQQFTASSEWSDTPTISQSSDLDFEEFLLEETADDYLISVLDGETDILGEDWSNI